MAICDIIYIPKEFCDSQVDIKKEHRAPCPSSVGKGCLYPVWEISSGRLNLFDKECDIRQGTVTPNFPRLRSQGRQILQLHTQMPCNKNPINQTPYKNHRFFQVFLWKKKQFFAFFFNKVLKFTARFAGLKFTFTILLATLHRFRGLGLLVLLGTLSPITASSLIALWAPRSSLMNSLWEIVVTRRCLTSIIFQLTVVRVKFVLILR